MSLALQVDGLGNFRDSNNRVMVLRGLNMDSSGKLPCTPNIDTYSPQDDTFWNGEDISFVGRPFWLEDAPEHLNRIRSWGYNVIRYVYTWEALEHKGPGIYDDEFIDYTIKVLNMLKEYGFYVFMDPHQDLWSRYGGGSGAPLWTYYAAGLNPKAFAATEAALVQNSYADPESFPKMVWSTNYARLAGATMFTCFFGGREYCPKAIINGENIQDYLQGHMMNAMKHFYKRIQNETSLFDDCVVGVETMNEPNSGYIGLQDITIVPEDQLPKLSTCPTALQSMILGTGQKAVVDNYVFGKLGPSKSGTVTVDPKGESAWLQDDSWDQRYGWKRGEEWKLGECIWALHNVWDPESQAALKPNYFGACPVKGHDIDEPYFVNVHFRRYWDSFYKEMRELLGEKVFLFCQPPTNAIPPDLKGSDSIDERVVYTPHYYDGLTLMLKTWTRWWNIDVIGLLRGDYLTPVFGIKIGEQNVRNCMRNQLKRIRKEGLEHMGDVPCLMSETGMPMDMDNKKAYKDGDYTSQILATDCISYALEGADMSLAYWCYCSNNTNRRGDAWNGEDFSFWSTDHVAHQPGKGTRIEDSINRPYAQAIFGRITDQVFNLKKQHYQLQIEAEKFTDESSRVPTLVYVPHYQYRSNNFKVTISTGNYEYDEKSQILSWYHEPGPQSLGIEPLSRQQVDGGTIWDICGGCTIM